MSKLKPKDDHQRSDGGLWLPKYGLRGPDRKRPDSRRFMPGYPCCCGEEIEPVQCYFFGSQSGTCPPREWAVDFGETSWTNNQCSFCDEIKNVFVLAPCSVPLFLCWDEFVSIGYCTVATISCAWSYEECDVCTAGDCSWSFGIRLAYYLNYFYLDVLLYDSQCTTAPCVPSSNAYYKSDILGGGNPNCDDLMDENQEISLAKQGENHNSAQTICNPGSANPPCDGTMANTIKIYPI